MVNSNAYNIQNWGGGYFRINAQGQIEITIDGDSKGVALEDIVAAAKRAGLHLPLLIRCSDILQDRVKQLYRAFALAIEETQYQGQYSLVYPIKVNQQQSVVRELLRTAEHRIGLEAGSKPELMAALGMLSQQPGKLVCNGYKDRAYIRSALIAQQMGHQVFLVIEKRSELELILEEAKRMDIRPCIGIRIRLASTGAGKWKNSCGSKSKFGLTAEQVLDLIQVLKRESALDCLQLMHCHLGSQIADILDIRSSMGEVARYYIELLKLGAPIQTVDVGGGLGVDYEGTCSKNDCSMNYSPQEYAANILIALRDVCLEAGVKQPDLISESGRALTAHHAVLISNIIGQEPIENQSQLPLVLDEDPRLIHDILDTYLAIPGTSPLEIYNFASHALQEAHAKFKHGVLGLSEKAKVEQIFQACCWALLEKINPSLPVEQALQTEIQELLATKVFCNLSFFQSLPDAWAIDQIFPVAPISQLNQTLQRQSILQDLTCDSDGCLKAYTGSAQLSHTLMLPEYRKEQPYALGFFLVGAYQEILGNLHNLFGDTNSLDLKLLANGEFELTDLNSGDTLANVLNYAHYDIKKLLQSYEKQLLNTTLSEERIAEYLNELRSLFPQLTYLDTGRK